MHDVLAQGMWSIMQRAFHINAVELMAAYRACVTFLMDIHNWTVLVMSDNIAAVFLTQTEREGPGCRPCIRRPADSGILP